MVRLAVAIVAVVVGAASCALFSEGPPENTCRGDGDCFQAQGEVCNLDTKRCEPGPDAGVPVDAAPADAAPTD
jgi:hypothetical protein